MAEVKVLDLGAVLKNARVIYHPADGRLGGEDTLGICAHAVIGAEPDTPHDVYIRKLFAYFGKRFVGNAGVVHVKICAAEHERENFIERCRLVAYLRAAEIKSRVVEVYFVPVKCEAVIQLRIRHRCRRE